MGSPPPQHPLEPSDEIGKERMMHEELVARQTPPRIDPHIGVKELVISVQA